MIADRDGSQHIPGSLSILKVKHIKKYLKFLANQISQALFQEQMRKKPGTPFRDNRITLLLHCNDFFTKVFKFDYFTPKNIFFPGYHCRELDEPTRDNQCFSALMVCKAVVGYSHSSYLLPPPL